MQKKCDHVMIQECPHRQLAANICEVFEDLLDTHNIDIPDDNRTGAKDEAHLYGDAWCDTEDNVMQLLLEYAPKVKPDLNVVGRSPKQRKR